MSDDSRWRRLVEAEDTKATLARMLMSPVKYLSNSEYYDGALMSGILADAYKEQVSSRRKAIDAACQLLKDWLKDFLPEREEALKDLFYLLAITQTLEANTMAFELVGKMIPREGTIELRLNREFRARLLSLIVDCQYPMVPADRLQIHWWLDKFSLVTPENLDDQSYVDIIWLGMLQYDIDEAWCHFSDLANSSAKAAEKLICWSTLSVAERMRTKIEAIQHRLDKRTKVAIDKALIHRGFQPLWPDLAK